MTSPRFLLAAIAVTAMAGASARADVIDIAWSAEGRFEHRAEVAPGGFAEVCGKLARGTVVRWAFESAGPMDFNIHYHEGEKVVFPVQRAGATKGAATLKVKLDQDYCWMWSNKRTQPLALQLTLAR
jgi:hypothetical protein